MIWLTNTHTLRVEITLNWLLATERTRRLVIKDPHVNSVSDDLSTLKSKGIVGIYELSPGEMPLHTRVQITKAISFHDSGAGGDIDIELPAGTTGRVVDIGDELNRCIIVKLDSPFDCLNEWDNSVTFDLDADGCQGVGTVSDYLTAI